MTYVFVSQSNISYLKKIVHNWCSDIKSSHNSESIAAGLGFNTHAALLASMKMNASPSLSYFGLDSCQQRLAQFGYNLPQTSLEIALKETCWPLPAWLTVSRNDRTRMDRWFYQCENWNIPYITITKKRKYAVLEWDCITVDAAAETLIRSQRERDLVRELFSRFQHVHKKNPAKGFFEGNWFCGKVVGLWPSVAAELAEDFLEILWRPVMSSDRNRFS